jgi:hypothetical protein
MVDTTPFLPGLSPLQGKAVVARFDGGRLSSEGGLLVLREVERRLGLADRLAACLNDPRTPEKIVHRLDGDYPVSHADDCRRVRGRQ